MEASLIALTGRPSGLGWRIGLDFLEVERVSGRPSADWRMDRAMRFRWRLMAC